MNPPPSRFLLLGRFEPGVAFQGAEFTIHVDPYLVEVHQDGAWVLSWFGSYKNSFEREVLSPFYRLISALALAGFLETDTPLDVRSDRWVEVKGEPETVVGRFWELQPFLVSNDAFLDAFARGGAYARQAFISDALWHALQDLERARRADPDEKPYHCHHALEAIKSGFGGDWERMRGELGLEAPHLRQVTDLSNRYSRHGESFQSRANLKQEAFLAEAKTAYDYTRECVRTLRDKLGQRNAVGRKTAYRRR